MNTTTFISRANPSVYESKNTVNLSEIVKEGTSSASLVVNRLRSDQLSNLLFNDSQYGNYLRILILRVLLQTSAARYLKADKLSDIEAILDFLGFENFGEYLAKKHHGNIRGDLMAILATMENDLILPYYFPVVLENNLKQLAEMVGLNKTEIVILGFAILLHAEPILDDGTEFINSRMSSIGVPRVIASILKYPLNDIELAFEETSKLATSGLLSIIVGGESSLRSKLDIITWTFSKRMLHKQQHVREVVKGFVRSSPPAFLTVEDYKHVEDRFLYLGQYLQSTLENKKTAVNILIYGKPGTGKTEFTKLLAHEINAHLLEVNAKNIQGQPVTPMRRLKSFCLAQSLFANARNLILFDECEEILSMSRIIEHSNDEPTTVQKSWVNQLLESNVIPTIWIANSIQSFDEAFLRRFDYCFEMEVPPEPYRLKLYKNMIGERVDEEILQRMAKSSDISPALIAKTSNVLSTVPKQQDRVSANKLAITLINDRLAATGKPKIEQRLNKAFRYEFESEFMNASVDIESLAAGLSSSRHGKICLYGPPGTGKTAFGRWIAEKIGARHLVKRGSDLLGSYVGETEHNIAQAFSDARSSNAVLQFDEIDTFLIDRAEARHSWEVSMVNEMLTQMESFEGLFIASTNRFDNLDAAALRRFDINIKLDYMKRQAVIKMLSITCEYLGIECSDLTASQEFMGINNLTPGDFIQVINASKFIKPKDIGDLRKKLTDAVKCKQISNFHPIGFSSH